MGLFSKIKRRLKRSGAKADTLVEDLKTPHVMCPRCRHQWQRKPSTIERLAGMAGQISMKELLYIYRNYCVGCDKRFKSINEATIDHIQPKAKGGTNGLHNYQLLCESCNHRKGSKWSGGYHNPTVQLRHLIEVNDLVALKSLAKNNLANPQTSPKRSTL